MKPLDVVIFGLSVTSSWGNGHATTYRALLKAFAERGHKVVFAERDVAWYAAHRDLPTPDFCDLRLYRTPDDLESFRARVAQADAVIVGSYVPDGIEVLDFVRANAGGVVAFYDIDTPVTLARLEAGACGYIAKRQIPDLDVYLSFTGGPTLARLEDEYGAPRAAPLYCSVDEDVYRPTGEPIRHDLGYLGTYSDDRQPVLEKLLIEPARRAPSLSFVVAGAQYPDEIEWPANVTRVPHVPPADHPAFYSSCRFTLNVTRADMVRAGHSPSVRLFEAAACGAPIISDTWAGLDELFVPGREIILAEGADDVLAALAGTAEAMRRSIAEAARRKTLGSHTARHRAMELERSLLAALGDQQTNAALRRDRQLERRIVT